MALHRRCLTWPTFAQKRPFVHRLKRIETCNHASVWQAIDSHRLLTCTQSQSDAFDCQPPQQTLRERWPNAVRNARAMPYRTEHQWLQPTTTHYRQPPHSFANKQNSITMNAVWRLLAQRRFDAVEESLQSTHNAPLSPADSTRIRALLVLHRDGVHAAMRLVPLPHDVFVQCFERAESLDLKRDVALTQLRACAASPAMVVAYEQALELTLFHVLVPRAEFDAANALLNADRVLSAEHRAFFELLLQRAAAEYQQRSHLQKESPLISTHGAAVTTTASTPLVQRRLAFDDDEVVATPVPKSVSWKRYLLLTLLGASSAGVVYRVWLWWSRRPRRQLLA